MALAHVPDIAGWGTEQGETATSKRGEATTFTMLVQTTLDVPASRAALTMPDRRLGDRSIYDMPIEPLPAPSLAASHAASTSTDAIVLPFVHPAAVHDVSPMDYRPLWVAAAFLAASLCASVTLAPTWFAVDPADATSIVQRVASHLTALIGITGIAALAAVVSTVLLLVGAQRTSKR